MSRDLHIRLYKAGRSDDGENGYWQTGYDFKLSEFGGALPNIGDVIVPFAAGIRDVTKLKAFQVEGSLFRPAGTHAQFCNVALIVTERNVEQEEEHLITGGG